MKHFILFILVIFMALSCGQQKSSEAVADTTSVDAVLINQQDLKDEMPYDPYANGKGEIIKTANYRFQVTNVKTSQESIEGFARKYNAYISKSDLVLENPVLEQQMTIRVLSAFFDDLLKDIDSQPTFVNYRKITTDDVAKEFVDLESRLRTKRELEQRYTQILRNKAGTIEELLKAEQQISALHEEIEATVSRMNYLRDQVRYSTINVELYQTITQQITEAPTPPFGKKFSEAFNSGLMGAINLLVALTYLWPLFTVAILTFIIWRKWKTIIARLKT